MVIWENCCQVQNIPPLSSYGGMTGWLHHSFQLYFSCSYGDIIAAKMSLIRSWKFLSICWCPNILYSVCAQFSCQSQIKLNLNCHNSVILADEQTIKETFIILYIDVYRVFKNCARCAALSSCFQPFISCQLASFFKQHLKLCSCATFVCKNFFVLHGLRCNVYIMNYFEFARKIGKSKVRFEIIVVLFLILLRSQ